MPFINNVTNKHLRKWIWSIVGKHEETKPTYYTLMCHIPHHNIRDWLLRGAKDEDAKTIACAIARLSDGELERRFARMLSK